MGLPEDIDLDQRLGLRIKAARLRAGLTLEQLAERTAVSRAMISRIERGESSPTAALLVKLGSGLGLTMSALLEDRADGTPLSRRCDQAVWRDPKSGYRRRNVSPRATGSGFEIVDVELPPGAEVQLDSANDALPLDQQIWVLGGVLDLTVDGVEHRLEPGDCLQMHLSQSIRFRNEGAVYAHYAVIVATQGYGQTGVSA